MKAFNGYEAKEQVSALPPIPAGCYIAQIIGARVETTDYGERLAVQVEVTEGEFKGYYKSQFMSKQGGSYEPRYAGILRLNVPTGDGSERDGWAVRSFNGAMWCIEQSNSGYRWDWNEAGLKGKAVGINVREKEYEVNGVNGVTTEIAHFEAVENIRNGKAKPAKRKELKNKPAAAPAAQFTEVEDDELPF